MLSQQEKDSFFTRTRSYLGKSALVKWLHHAKQEKARGRMTKAVLVLQLFRRWWENAEVCLSPLWVVKTTF